MKKWKQEGDSWFVRQFGPIKATICRHWGMTPEPTEYRAFLSIGDIKFVLPISDIGVSWLDDTCDKVAVRILEKMIKREIRQWLK